MPSFHRKKTADYDKRIRTEGLVLYQKGDPGRKFPSENPAKIEGSKTKSRVKSTRRIELTNSTKKNKTNCCS